MSIRCTYLYHPYYRRRSRVKVVLEYILVAVLVAIFNPYTLLYAPLIIHYIQRKYLAPKEWGMEEVAKFVDLLNEERRKLGYQSLEVDYSLRSFVEVRWWHVRDYYVETGELEHHMFRRDVVKYGLLYRGVAECCQIDSMYPTPEEALECFKKSKPHWKILTDPEMKYIYVICRRAGDTYLIVVIVTRK
ncbi:MAG: hypothetical protein DRJ40_11850 [Thermoprotei archaeon]|nr:MAG: hypothetical protein DRJ40_11850 [Thermoprotei archaeon]